MRPHAKEAKEKTGASSRPPPFVQTCYTTALPNTVPSNVHACEATPDVASDAPVVATRLATLHQPFEPGLPQDAVTVVAGAVVSILMVMHTCASVPPLDEVEKKQAVCVPSPDTVKGAL